jgi:hypothetical protein
MHLIKPLAIWLATTIATAIVGYYVAEHNCWIRHKSSQVSATNVTLSLSPETGTTAAAKGIRHQILINLSGKEPCDTLYVHLFVKENTDSSYYYQSSEKMLHGHQLNMPVWLGLDNDGGKTFSVYAVVNDTPYYCKAADLLRMQTLPATEKARLQITRAR